MIKDPWKPKPQRASVTIEGETRVTDTSFTAVKRVKVERCPSRGWVLSVSGVNAKDGNFMQEVTWNHG